MNNEITPTGILSMLDTTKAERSSFVDNVVNTMLGGYVEPINIHLQVKSMEEIYKAIKAHPDYNSMVLESAHNYGKSFEFRNAKIAIRDAAGKWDYSHDHEWVSLKAQLENRQEYLKAIKEPVERITADGEVVTDVPATYTPGSETIFVTLK